MSYKLLTDSEDSKPLVDSSDDKVLTMATASIPATAGNYMVADNSGLLPKLYKRADGKYYGFTVTV